MSLIILDRDGVINQDSDAYIRSEDQWHAIPGSLNAIARLAKAGYFIAIATNQSGVGRGLFDFSALNRIHEKMAKAVLEHGGALHFIAFCPHTPEDHCHCRKPKTGLIDQIETALGAQVQDQTRWFVGDAKSDIQAGLTKNMSTALVRTGKGAKTLAAWPKPHPFWIFDDLAAFTDALLSNSIT